MSRSCSSIFCHINVRIAYTICGILIGLFWACVYIISFKNWSALAMCLTATAFAFETLYIYISLKKDWIIGWKPGAFTFLLWPNIVIGTLGIWAMIACIIIAAVNHQGVGPSDQKGENMWSTATWCLVLTKWTWQNALFAWMYGKKLKVVTVEVESIGDPSAWKY